ncbi:MAG: hypothetical protein IKN42_03390 [Elusimicrobia bacterium]|nr:hypothetical protein [Elusimicrobiota bacterium]
MNIFKFLVMLFCVMLISACATTYERAKSPTGTGYYDTLLQQDMYEITFNGNSDTSVTTAQDYALLRAAETCLENGYKTFDIVNSNNNSKTETDAYTNYYGRYYANTTVFTSTYPKIMLIIKCSKENNLTFIAEEIKLNLRKKHNIEK